MLDTETGEVVNRTLMHEGNQVREFYSELPRPVLVGGTPRSGVAAFLSAQTGAKGTGKSTRGRGPQAGNRCLRE
jgi:hypothetical protein